LKIKNLSKYLEVKERREYLNQKESYIKNMPFRLAVYFSPDPETKEVYLEVYLESLFSSKFRFLRHNIFNIKPELI
jgi:hypothetical protein